MGSEPGWRCPCAREELSRGMTAPRASLGRRYRTDVLVVNAAMTERGGGALASAGDAAGLRQELLQVHLPLQRLAAARGRIGELLVEGLAPLQVFLFFEEDVVEDAHGGSVADGVGDGEVVAIVDGEVRLEDAVEADDAQELV